MMKFFITQAENTYSANARHWSNPESLCHTSTTLSPTSGASYGRNDAEAKPNASSMHSVLQQNNELHLIPGGNTNAGSTQTYLAEATSEPSHKMLREHARTSGTSNICRATRKATSLWVKSERVVQAAWEACKVELHTT
jgi:hypothetical protein